MKTQKEIEDRLRGLLCQELDRRIQAASARLPHACRHNHRHTLDHRRTVEGSPNYGYNRVTDTKGLPVVQTMGLCMLDSEAPDRWKGDICEDPIDAQRCPYFDPKLTPARVYDQFLDDLASKDLSPDVRALFWVLGGATTKLPWWKRLWSRYILRVDYEPLQSPVRELARDMLPSPEEYVKQITQEAVGAHDDAGTPPGS
jgi:hypothetical protein